MQASRRVLVESSVWFKKQVTASKEVRLLNMDQKHAVTFHTWLSILHGSVPDFLYSIENIPLPIVFAVMDASRHYGFDVAKFSPWFAQWFDTNLNKFNLTQLELLLVLAADLNRAQAVAGATKRLSYEKPGHIHAYNWTKYKHREISPRIDGKLNKFLSMS
jgi:hypothetical protein